MSRDDTTEPLSGEATRPQAKAAPPAPEPVKVVDRRWWVRDDEATGDTGAYAPPKPSYVEQLEKQLAEKDQLLQSSIARFREASAEFEAVRARMRRDVAKDIERGRRTMLVELLDVVDNLDRAIQSASAGSAMEAVLKGIEMVRELFLAKLGGFGVHPIPSVGQPFDPARHDAITMVPTHDPASEGLVVGVVAEGYMIGEEVLRPARVAVARLVPGESG
jgi:molecular chaperone GrpE